MTWQVFIFASVVLTSIATLLQRILLKDEKSDPVSFSIFFQLLTGLLIGAFGSFFSDMSFPSRWSGIWVNLILMTVLYALGNVFIFKSLKLVEASVFTVIFSSRALFTTLGSTLLLHEGLNARQMGGTLLIILGVVLVTLKSAKISFSRNEIYALLAGACFGFANTNDRILLKTLNLYPFVFLAFVVPAIMIAVVKPNAAKKMKAFFGKILLTRMIMLCIVYAVSAITFFAALQASPNSSQVASMNLTNVILTVLLSIVFLHERTNVPKKLAGAIASFVGLLLVR